MPARVLMVHDEAEFLGQAVAAIEAAGYDVASFDNPMTALAVLEGRHNVELLITRVMFPPGNPNGVSLALMAKHMRQAIPLSRPELKVLFVARAENRQYSEGVGEFMEAPASISELVEVVGRLMGQTR